MIDSYGNWANNNRSFNLKVVFKNIEIQQIYILKNKIQDDLEGLIYLLNERINNNIYTNSNNIDFNENKSK